MRILNLAFLLAVVFLGSCSNVVKDQPLKSTSVPFDTLLDQYYEDRLKLYPLEATSAGDDRYNDVLPNSITVEFESRLRDFYSHYQNQLGGYDTTAFSDNDKLSYEVLDWTCSINLQRLSFKERLMPMNQFWSLPLSVGILASGKSSQPFKSVKDYDNWLSRLDQFVVWCDTAIVNMRKGIAEGYVLPKILAERMLDQFKPFASGKAQDHLFFQPVKNFPDDFTEEDKTRLMNSYAQIIDEKIIPVYSRLHDFVKTEYIPQCRETAGISDIPKGDEYYSLLIKFYTTTDLPANEIFELGQSEVERITREMEAIKTQVGFQGNLKEFFNHLREKKELMPFTKPEQVIENFNRIHERMKPHLAKLFDKVPLTPFEVRRTEAFREASASASYTAGSLDRTRPGIFYVPIPDVKKYNTISDEDLFLHEAIPGHHYQISLQRENEDLPRFRKTSGYSAYSEGWALYTESLGKELGLYEDPYQYFGMLSAEMHRAIRLVVDAGMHTKGWTREQAIQYSLDHEAEDERSVIAEIERYMAIPGQALSYKIGQLKMRELRSKAEKALGARFNIAEFHNQILDSGNLPLAILENKIDRWIAKEKKLM